MELIVQKRDKFGKAVKVLRRAGLIPAELYGQGAENLHLSVPLKDFNKVFKHAGESTVINLVLDSDRRSVMVHDIAADPVTDEIVSIDFYEVRMDKRIKVKTPINFVGEAPAVKDKGGVLVKAMHEIELEALPGNLPHALDADLGLLREIGASIRVGDLKVPEGVKLLVSLETVVATVTEKAEEEAVAPPPEVSVESVKVETEEKKAERLAKKETVAQTAEPKAQKPQV